MLHMKASTLIHSPAASADRSDSIFTSSSIISLSQVIVVSISEVIFLFKASA